MSGDPDVLEYFRSKSSRKPIRTIDLQECEVTAQVEVWPMRRPIPNQHLFVVKTSTRVFYLLAKTAEEMNCWVRSIGQICTFSALNDSTESVDSPAHTPPSLHASPALSPHVPLTSSQDAVTNGDSAVRDMPSESDSSPPLDYLFLSQCETGRKTIARCDSMSNSERSFEQSSFENMSEDVFSPAPCTDPSPFNAAPCTDPSPFSAPAGTLPLSACAYGVGEVFRFDRPFCATPDSHTPPPLPPKPNHLSDHHSNDDVCCNHGQPGILPRRTSLSGLEHFRRGEFESSKRHWNKRLSLNLPLFLGSADSQSEDSSYVPMASPPVICSDTSDGYIPMSPSALPVSLLSNGKAESPLPPTPEMEPPPVNRSLKPRRRVKPPPLDLRGLSTISECPAHPLTLTEPRWRGRGLNGAEQEAVMTPGSLFAGSDPAPWLSRFHLDYLSLDFNSASPSPVQKKPLLDEQRVDYVQVDEKKTQALQNTRTEWTDIRQSKV
ncbi:GRB2-associated-binding protein 3 isoform X2 [Brachyhypopomus gauderio]